MTQEDGASLSTTQEKRERTRETALEIRGLVAGYGPIEVLHGIDLVVYEGEVVTLLGGNAAGKTTTMRCITRLLQPTSGTIAYRGESLAELTASQVVRRGIASVPEGRRVFPRMSVMENLEMGAFCREDKAEIAAELDLVFALFPRLEERHRQKAGTLSGGEQQMLAMGRALMTRPQMIMIDEPSLGLSPRFVSEVFELILRLAEEGLTIMVVEQNATRALEISDRGYVLELGRNRYEGTGQELLNNQDVRRMYLGG